MEKKKISVIIPSYNHKDFVKQAINSVLNQTYKNFELIIIDDCSSDSSKKIIDSFKDSRIKKFYNGTNNGAVNTLNQLINLSNCEYIALLNSDDCWSKDKLEKQIEYLENNPTVGACFTWADLMDEKGKILYDCETTPINLFQEKNKTRSEWLRHFFDNGNSLCHPSVMIRKSVYDDLGLYKNTFKQLPDFEFWIRLIKKYDIHIIEENLVHFRILSGVRKNSSFLDDSNLNIMNYEMFSIKNSFFDNCDDKLFYEAFNDVLISKKCMKNEKFLEFEKCMILFNSRYYRQLGRFIAFEKLNKLLTDSYSQKIIEKEYNFSLNDYFELGKKITNLNVQYYDSGIEQKIPDHIINSRFYRWSNKLYNSKTYNFILKGRMKYRKLRGK